MLRPKLGIVISLSKLSWFSPAPHGTCDFHRIPRSTDYLAGLRPFLHSYYQSFFDSTSTFQYCFSCLFSVRQLISKIRNTFPCSDNPIRTYTFRFLLWNNQLELSCKELWSFVTLKPTWPHWFAFPFPETLHFVHSQVRQFPLSFEILGEHSNHEYFMDSRHIACPALHGFRLASADFTELHTIFHRMSEFRVYVSGRYSIIPYIRLSVPLHCCRSLSFFKKIHLIVLEEYIIAFLFAQVNPLLKNASHQCQ